MRTVLILTSFAGLLAGNALLAANWPQWRGPANDGVSTEIGLPVSWGAECRGTASAGVKVLNELLMPGNASSIRFASAQGRRG
jgi:hypothetical protein